MHILKILYLLISGTLLFSSPSFCQGTDSKNNSYPDGEFWRDQGLTSIIPFWQQYARDTVDGAYYLCLSREGTPKPPWDKHPAMISRQVFGFTSAYMLSGNEKYLRSAEEGVNYLLKYAWDKNYGGWYDLLDKYGNAKETTKTVPNQLYTNVGLSLYYFATRDTNVLSYIKKSILIQKKYSADRINGGYFQTLSRDLSVADSSKSKHSHYGYTSSLLINMMMFTRDEEIRRFADELMQISIKRMTDTSYGWFNGYPKPYDVRWKLPWETVNNEEVISAGAQLTAALSLLRMSEITGNKIYLSKGTMLGEQLLNSAWDPTRGCWFDIIKRKPPFEPQDTSTVYWWLQSYGMFLQLHLYHITGEKRYLDYYKKMAAFWNDCLVDEKWGGVYLNVTPSGALQTTDKALAWKASYHEMENALFNYLYLNLYVNSQPVTLYFKIKDSPSGSKHFVSPAEDPAVQITGVKINGKPWSSFDAVERSVNLPEGNDLRLEVTLGTKLDY